MYFIREKGALMNQRDKDVSVVIGFRDWGGERLKLCIESLHSALQGTDYEIIVSDYGSINAEMVEKITLSAGAIYHFSDVADQPWSRSRALNTGFNIASGKVLMCTDADMIFSPESLCHVYELICAFPNTTALIECRDLPFGWDDHFIQEKGINWELFERFGTFRGRWGMGGLVAFHKDVFDRIRGLDERMHTYGAEDLDFGQRTQRAGNRIHWVRQPGVRMYHMWHPSADQASHQEGEFKEIVDQNREIYYNDRSYIRNLVQWSGANRPKSPLVSVTICTRNRAHLLPDAINSVLMQSVQDFEIIILDDGSEDRSAQEVVASFNDSRIKYFYQECQGISSAHNAAIAQCSGDFIVNLDDDDLMPPWRLESQLKVIEAGILGSYGAFANFDNETGSLTMFNEKDIDVSTQHHSGGAPGHSTWMINRDVLNVLRYNEEMPSSEDNDLFLRLLRSGVHFRHTQEVNALRRVHKTQITQTDNQEHTYYASENRYWFRFRTNSFFKKEVSDIGLSQPWVVVRNHENIKEILRPYLPDHLSSERTVVIDGKVNRELFNSNSKITEYEISALDQGYSSVVSIISKCTLHDLALLRQENLEYRIYLNDCTEANAFSSIQAIALKDFFISQISRESDTEHGILLFAISDSPHDIKPFLSGAGNRWSICVDGDSRFLATQIYPNIKSAISAYKGTLEQANVNVGIISAGLKSHFLNTYCEGSE